MRLDAAGAAFIKKEEGLRLEAYRCGAGVPTIGWGHTRGVRPGDRITEGRAEELFREDAGRVECCINAAVKACISQNMFNALCSFVFNVGCGAFRSSRLLRKVNADPSDASIVAELEKWSYAGGVFTDALFRRRQREARLYFGED